MNSNLNSTEQAARDYNADHRAAEDAHRNRRLDRDAIMSAALDRLESTAREESLPGYSTWVAYYVQALTGRFVLPDDVPAVISEIRAQLSPAVRG